MIFRNKEVFERLKDKHYTVDEVFRNKLKQQLFGGQSMAKKHLQLKELLHQRNFKLASALAVALIVGVSAFGVHAQSQRNASQRVIDDNIKLADNLDGVLSTDQIRDIAVKDAQNGASISKIELENEEGTTVYKVVFSDGTIRLYNARTGEAFVKTAETEGVPAGFVAGISLQQARDIALAQRPGKVITKIELESEDGKIVYSVRFSDGGSVDVNATDGSVVRVRDGSGSTSTSSSSSDDSSDDTNDDNGGSSSGSGSTDSNNTSDDKSGSGSGSSGSGSKHSGSDD